MKRVAEHDIRAVMQESCVCDHVYVYTEKEEYELAELGFLVRAQYLDVRCLWFY